jgi:soluble lytic murein transglycosylase-like protein
VVLVRRGSWSRRLLHVVVLASIAGPACAQIYAGAGERGAVVLSNFPSAETPELLISAPPAPAQAAPAQAAPAPAAPAPAAGSSKAQRYVAMIDKVARETALSPKLLHAVIEVESGYEPRAVSRKGALGLMQLMPATAQRFGVRDAMDPAQNIRGGALYLRWLLDYFRGDLRLALAAYNAGELAVVKAGYRIPPLAETIDYVPKVLARLNRAVVG